MVVAALIIYGSLVPFDLNTLEPLNLLVALDAHSVRTVAASFELGCSSQCRRRTGAWLLSDGRVALDFRLWPGNGCSRPVGCRLCIIAAGRRSRGAAGVLADARQFVERCPGSDRWRDRGKSDLGRHWPERRPVDAKLSDERELSTRAIRLLYLYLPIYLVLQLTSVDTVSSSEARDEIGPGGVISVRLPPTLNPASSSCVTGSGMDSSMRRSAFWPPWLAQAGPAPQAWLGLPARCLSSGSVSVMKLLAGLGAPMRAASRSHVGVGAGIAVTTRFPLPGHDLARDRLRVVRICLVLATAAWLLLLVVAWYPFDFQLTSDIVNRRLSSRLSGPVRLLLLVRVLRPQPAAGGPRRAAPLPDGRATRIAPARCLGDEPRTAESAAGKLGHYACRQRRR